MKYKFLGRPNLYDSGIELEPFVPPAPAYKWIDVTSNMYWGTYWGNWQSNKWAFGSVGQSAGKLGIGVDGGPNPDWWLSVPVAGIRFTYVVNGVEDFRLFGYTISTTLSEWNNFPPTLEIVQTNPIYSSSQIDTWEEDIVGIEVLYLDTGAYVANGYITKIEYYTPDATVWPPP